MSFIKDINKKLSTGMSFTCPLDKNIIVEDQHK